MAVSRRDFLLTALAVPAVDAVANDFRPNPNVQHAILHSSGAAADPFTVANPVPLRQITVPGKAFAISTRRFLSELKSAYLASSPYPIARAFDILPFRLIDRGVGTRLVARGNLNFSAGQVSNQGEYIEAEFNDQNLGLLTVVFDESLSAAVSQPSDSELLFDFSSKPPIILLQGANRQYQVDSNQRLLSIKLGSTSAVYRFKSGRPNSNQSLEVTVDLAKDERAMFGREAPIQIASLVWPPRALILLTSGNTVCKCNCCGKDVCSPPCPDEGQPSTPPFADLYADCLWKSGSRVTAFFRSNVLNQSSDYDATQEWKNRTIVVRERAFTNCGDSTAGSEIGSARFVVDQITINEVIPPVSPPRYTTYIYGAYKSAS